MGMTAAQSLCTITDFQNTQAYFTLHLMVTPDSGKSYASTTYTKAETDIFVASTYWLLRPWLLACAKRRNIPGNLKSNNQKRYVALCRSQWPRGLRRGYAATLCWEWGFESRRRHGTLSDVSVVCCHVEVSASGRSLIRRSPTGCGVSKCDSEASIMRKQCSLLRIMQWEDSFVPENHRLYV